MLSVFEVVLHSVARGQIIIPFNHVDSLQMLIDGFIWAQILKLIFRIIRSLMYS